CCPDPHSFPTRRSSDLADADPEQDVPGLLAQGIDHTELLGMVAPRPVLIGAATRDFFPIEGTRQTFREAQELYKKLGVPDRVKRSEEHTSELQSLAYLV